MLLIIDNMLVIYWLRHDCVPDIFSSITVKTDLSVLLMYDKNPVPAGIYSNLLSASLETMSQLLNLMALVKGWCEDKASIPLSHHLDIAIKCLEEHLESPDEDSGEHRRQSK